MQIDSGTLLALQSTAETERKGSVPSAQEQDKMMQAAKEFESVYIAQMLTYSGLDEALTKGGGQGADAFTGYYLNQLAEVITEKGGFGLADNIYEQLVKYSEERNGNSVKI